MNSTILRNIKSIMILKRYASIDKINILSKNVAPIKPRHWECCYGPNCETCVWATYFEKLGKYKKKMLIKNNYNSIKQ
jgi:hypothetical protein